MAKWPGSSLWFRGWVVDMNDIEYQIRFDDEAKTELVLKHKDVKSAVNFKRSSSKGRSRSRGRSSSRGRTSKGRSPARNKSPGRRGRPPKTQEKEVDNVITTTTTTTTTTEEEVTVLTRGAQEAETLVWAKNDSPLPSLRPRLARADLHTPRTSTPTRQSPRLAAMTNNKVNDVEVNNVKPQKVEVEVTAVKQPGVVRRLGSLLCGVACGTGCMLKRALCALVPSMATVINLPTLLIMLAMPVVLNEMCTKSKCTVMEFPSIPQKLQYYYDPMAIAMVLGFIVVQTLLCLVPLGRKVQPISGASVRCNSFVAVVLTLAVVPVCLYMDYNILIVYSKYRHIMATSLVIGLVVGLVAYIHGHYAPKDARNPECNSGSFVADLVVGREVAPVVLSLDLKFVMFRIVCLAQIVISVLIVVKDMQGHQGQYSPTMLLASIMQIFYAANWIWFEDAYFTTYEYQRQGCGLFLILGDLAMAFVLPIFARFVLNHRTELEWYWLTAIALVNLTGYTICRGSNNQKHAFRSNPSDPALARLESLPTAAGTRLLVSGWWGLVRHPNYLGDILVFISWALVCGFTHALPWVLVGLDVLFLVARTYEVESRCSKKYGTAWDNYTKRVKCRLIPKVF